MMAFNVRQMPADRAAALIGEDDVAVFSQRLETMAATSQFDLEEPDSTRLTFPFEVGKDDLLREGNWLDGVDYMSDLVFETPRDLAGKIFKRFETFADDGHTPSEALADVRWGFARFGGVKRLADAALAASCATLSPNTADPCLVARLAAESRERSRSLTDPCTQARGAKRAAGSSKQDGTADGRRPAL